MGKDVIIILIIILSYKILMKYSKIIEGVDGNNGDNGNNGDDGNIFQKFVGTIAEYMDKIAQISSDNVMPTVCEYTGGRPYDSLRRQCVEHKVGDRPDKCKPKTDINCTYKYYDPSKSCSSYTEASDCNEDIECMYDFTTKVCKNNTNICSFREDFCSSKNYSHWGSIEPLVQLYIQQSSTLDSQDILLSEFLKDNQTVPDFKIKDEDIADMIKYYNNATEQISSVTNNITVTPPSFSKIIPKSLNGDPAPDDPCSNPENKFDGNGNKITCEPLSAVVTHTLSGITDTSKNGLIDALFNSLKEKDNLSIPRNENNVIYENVLRIILHLYFYYETRIYSDTSGVNLCTESKNENGDSFCTVDSESDQCVNSVSDRNKTILEEHCKNKSGSDCLLDPLCEIKGGWNVCDPGTKLIDDNDCVELPNDEYSGTYDINGSLINMDDFNFANSDLADDNQLGDKTQQFVYFTDNVQKCYMGNNFFKTNTFQKDVVKETRERPVDRQNHQLLSDSPLPPPKKNVNIFGTVPNKYEYPEYYKNSMCISCFDKDIINETNRSFITSESTVTSQTYGELCGVKGSFNINNYSKCSDKHDKTSCNNNKLCIWEEYDELLTPTGNDSDDGRCIQRCPRTYYSENDGQCVKTSENNFPVQTSSIYKKCKGLGRVECEQDNDCSFYNPNPESVDGKCFPALITSGEATTPNTLTETLNNHIFSLYDMLGETSSFTYNSVNPQDKNGFTGDNNVVLDNFDIPIMDDELPCWYLGKEYDYFTKTCRDCPENTRFRVKDDYSDGECVNELTYDELLHTIDDTLNVYKDSGHTNPSADPSTDRVVNFLNTHYTNKVSCNELSKSKDGKSDWPDIGKHWYKPNCNIEGEADECIFTDVSDSQKIIKNCLPKIGCKTIEEDGSFTCVPTEDNKVDLTLKDIGYDYFKLLNPTDPTTINDYITNFKTLFNPDEGSVGGAQKKDTDENPVFIRNRKELCDYNGSHGTCQTCYDEETMTDNTRTEDGKGCIESCEPDGGSNIDKNTNFNIPYKSVTNKCSAWGDKYEENKNKYWPSIKLNDNKVSLDIINDPDIGGHEKNYFLFMDIKTNVAFIDLIRQFERNYLPQVIFSSTSPTTTVDPTDIDKNRNKKAYIAQNKKVRIPWQYKDGRILKVGISTPLRSDTSNFDNIQIDRIALGNNKYFNNSYTNPVFPDEKYYYTRVNDFPETLAPNASDTPNDANESCFTLCNKRETCDLLKIDGGTCNFYYNVEKTTIEDLSPVQTPGTDAGTSPQYYKKDYPTISKSSTTEGSPYVNTGSYFSALDFLSSNLCRYGYYNTNASIASSGGITNYSNGDTDLDGSGGGVVARGPFNFYNKFPLDFFTEKPGELERINPHYVDYINQLSLFKYQEPAQPSNNLVRDNATCQFSHNGNVVPEVHKHVTSSYYYDSLEGFQHYTLTPQTVLSDDTTNSFRYFYPEKIRNMYYKTNLDPMTDNLEDVLTTTPTTTLTTITGTVSTRNQNIFLMPENDILYYLDKTNKNNEDTINYDEYGLPVLQSLETSSVELKDIKYIDRRRLSIGDDNEDPNDNFIYPLLNNTIAYVDEFIENQEIQGTSEVFNFLSDSVDDNNETRTELEIIKYAKRDPGGESTARSVNQQVKQNIMTERFIYLKDVTATVMTGGEIQIDNGKKNYIKYRTVFDILLNYCPLSGLPGVSTTKDSTTEGEHIQTPISIQLHYIYTSISAAEPLPDSGSDSQSPADKYSNSLEVYFVNYLLMKHILDHDTTYHPYWKEDSTEPDNISKYSISDDFLNVLKYDDDDTDGKTFFSYTNSYVFSGSRAAEKPSDSDQQSRSLMNVMYWFSGENELTLWGTISFFILFYGFLDFLIGDRADEILEEIIVKKCTDIPCETGEKQPYIRDSAKTNTIKYYVDQLIDYTYEMLGEYLETCIYIGDKNRMNITKSDLESCKKKGDNIVGCEKYFYQIIPYRKEKLYTNRSFIEIMKENTINDENGLTLSIFMNDYVDDIMKDFRDTSQEAILNRYTPLRYPIPETLNNEDTITIPENGAFIVELSINDSLVTPDVNNIYKTFYLYIKYPKGTVKKSKLYSQLVDLFRSDGLNNTLIPKLQSTVDSFFSTKTGETGRVMDVLNDERGAVAAPGNTITGDTVSEAMDVLNDERGAVAAPENTITGDTVSKAMFGYQYSTLNDADKAIVLSILNPEGYTNLAKDYFNDLFSNYNTVNDILTDTLKKSVRIDANGRVQFNENFTISEKHLRRLNPEMNNLPLAGITPPDVNWNYDSQKIPHIQHITESPQNISINLYKIINLGEDITLGTLPGTPSTTATDISDLNLLNYTILNKDTTSSLTNDSIYIVAPTQPTDSGNTDVYKRILVLQPFPTQGGAQSQQDENKLNDYYTKTSILNKMVEICNTPSDPHPSSNSSMSPINPSQNTGLLQAFFDDNETNEFNTLTNKGKYFSNITKNDIECVKLGDLYEGSNQEDPNLEDNMYDYCQIVDPQCQNLDDNGDKKCKFTNTSESHIIYRGDGANTSEQSKYYIFTSLQDISNKINNLVYNIYDYVQESSIQDDTGLDTFRATCIAPDSSNSDAVATCASVTELDTPDACVSTSVTSASGAGDGPVNCIYDINETINDYCKTSCQRIIPDTSNYKKEGGEPLTPVVPWPTFNLSKKAYNTYNNNELTYIDYTKDREPQYTINEHNLNNYKNYDVSENIFTNIYSYNANNCKEIGDCDVDNIKVFDVQQSFSQSGAQETGTPSGAPLDPINVKELEHFDRVWPKTTTSIAATNEDIYKCSRYCAINETCESIPDDGLLNDSRYIDDTDHNDYNSESGPLGRANPMFDNIFSQTNMANINPGYCPPFTKSGADGNCVYYTEGEGTNTGKVYDYNGDEAPLQLVTSTEGETSLFQISGSCHLQPKTFQDNIELFHACEEWYLQPTNDPEKSDQTNLDKCMSDLSQNGNTMNSKKYSIPDLKLEKEDTPDIVFKNRNKINKRFANSYGLPSCKINDQESDFNNKTCANFVTDYIVRENYYKLYSKQENEGLQKLNEYHIGPRSHNGKYVENNPIHNSKIGINPPSPLEPHLGDSYVAKDFIGKYEYAKYVNPNDIFDQTDGSATYDDLNKYKTEKLDPMYEQSDNTPPADSLYSNINRYITDGECATTEGTPNNWPFLGFPPTATVPTDATVSDG